MDLRFLRGDAQAPKGHAFFIAHSSSDTRVIFCTYCIVPPIPLSLTKYLPSFLAAQLPIEELGDATTANGMPIPPMLEEGNSIEHVRMLAEYRNDDVCDLGSINPRDEAVRLQWVQEGCTEYARLYHNYSLTFEQSVHPSMASIGEPDIPLDDLDAEAVLLQTMTDRERLTELGKLIGMARYALEGRDNDLLQDTKQKMQRIAGRLAEKYRGPELISAASDASERGARLAELYLERGFKLLDEQYADIPRIERAIRELQQS